MRTILCFGLATLVASALLVIACNRTPTRPSFLPTSSGAPPVFTTRIEIGGPGSVAPGQTVQFTATAHRSDQTTADVSSMATWRSSRSAVLSIAPGGLATGHTVGDANIQVTFQSSAMREIVVVPAGTFRLVGRVAESDNPVAGVTDAKVEVVGGAPGLSVLTGPDGRYRLYGVPATAEIRVTKAGYQATVQMLSLSDHQTQNFALTLAAPRANLAGTYTLTLSAAEECRAKLPEEVWTRRYTARVTQTGPLLDVSLAGATFVVDASSTGDGFRGQIEPNRVLFTLQYGDFYYYQIWPDIVEEIAPTLYFGSWGTVSAVVTPGNISGSLHGAFFTVDSDPRTTMPPPKQFCHSLLHQFVLQR